MKALSSKSLLFLAVLILASSVGAGKLKAQTPDVVFAVGEWPPYISEIIPGYGQHSELVKKVYAKAGMTVGLEFMPWKRAFLKTADGTYPGSFSWYYTEERSRQFLIPKMPIDETRIVVFYNKDVLPDGPSAKSLADMVAEKHSFVAIASYWTVNELRDLNANLHIVSSAKLAWRMLERGRISLFPESEQVGLAEGREFMGAHGMKRIAHTGPIKVDKMYPLFSPAHPEAEKYMAIWDRHAPSVIAPSIIKK